MSWDGNGIGDYLQIANDPRLHFDATDHCFGVWVRRDGDSNLSNNGPIFGTDGAGNLLHSLIVYSSTDGTNPNKVRFYIRDTAGNIGQIISTASIVNNVWTHLLVQREGNIVTLYIDGVADGTVDVSAVAPEDPGVNLFLFSISTAPGARHNGQLADFFKFDRALTSTEITAIVGGQRPTELRGALEQLLIFLPMDKDPIVAANMRDYHNRYELSHSGMADNSFNPPIYDPLPEVTTYFAASTHKKVQFTGSPYLDVTKETPYGILAVKTDNISRAVNWCLKYQREPDPSLRSPAGGPEGAFVPFIPTCGHSDYWLATETWLVPNRYGFVLLGQKTHALGYDVFGTNSGGCTKIAFNLGNKSIPCIINQAHQFVLRDMSICAGSSGSQGGEEIGLLNHKMVVNITGPLTTRTTDSAGVITFPSSVTGQGPITQEKVQLRWSGGVRYDVLVTSIQSIGESTRRIFTFSGGKGDNLPAQDTQITMHDWCYIPADDPGYARSGVLTGRTDDNTGVVTLDVNNTFFDTGDKITLVWSGGSRTSMTITSKVDEVISIDGGSGSVLPSTSTAVTIAVSNYNADDPSAYSTGLTSTQPNSRLQCHNTDWSGFSVAALQNAGYAALSNCDHHTLYETVFNECERGWLNINDQGLDIKFETVEWRGSGGAMFDFQAGGFFKGDHLLSAYSDSKVLNIGSGGSLKIGPGKNNGYFKLTDVKTDTEALNGAWIVYMEDETKVDRWVTVIIDGMMNARHANSNTSAESQRKFCRMVGRSTLIIRDSLYPGMVECFGNTVSAYGNSLFAPIIIFDNTQFINSNERDYTSIILVSGINNGVMVNNASHVNLGTTTLQKRPFFQNPLAPNSGLGSFWRPSGTGTVAGLSYNAGDLIYSSNINNTRKHIILAPYTGMSAES